MVEARGMFGPSRPSPTRSQSSLGAFALFGHPGLRVERPVRSPTRFNLNLNLKTNSRAHRLYLIQGLTAST